MTNTEIQELIARLEKNISEEASIFKILQYADEPEKSFIKANRQGILLFANQLLRAARDAEDETSSSSENIIVIDFDAERVGKPSLKFSESIPSITNPTKDDNHTNYRAFFSHKLFQGGCVVVMIILFIAVLIGIWTIGRWIF